MRTKYDGFAPELSNFFWPYLREQEAVGHTDYSRLTLWVAERLHQKYGVGKSEGIELD